MEASSSSEDEEEIAVGNELRERVGRVKPKQTLRILIIGCVPAKKIPCELLSAWKHKVSSTRLIKMRPLLWLLEANLRSFCGEERRKRKGVQGPDPEGDVC